MKNKSVLFLFVFCLNALGTAAQVPHDAVADFISRMDASRVSFDYEYVADGANVPVVGSGHIILQDGAWLLEGDGLRIWCDGKERWTVDVAAGEVVVENVSANDEVMPITLISSLPDIFCWNRISDFRYELHPKSGIDTDFASIVLLFDKSFLPSGAEMSTKNGGKISFSLSAIEFAPESSLAPIAISESSFDSSYFITDMR